RHRGARELLPAGWRGRDRDAPRRAAPSLHLHRARNRLAASETTGAGRRQQGRGALVTAPLVLGIETSCDETGVGIVRGEELLANTIASSMEEHARYGGVVPEIAARAHLEAMGPTLRAALAEAGVALGDIDAIAVTSGP